MSGNKLSGFAAGFSVEAVMQQALGLARHAASLGEVPVGAVVVDAAGLVVGSGYNRREIDRDPLAHAEILAIAEAAKKLGSWRLSGCSLVVTLEPCTMCAGAIVQARVDRVFFGAVDPKAGAVESLYKILNDPRLNHQVEVTGRVLESECSGLLKDFFAALRSQKKLLKTE